MPSDQQRAEMRALIELRDELKSDPLTPSFVFDDIQEAIDNMMEHGRMFMFEVREIGTDESPKEPMPYLTVKESASLLGVSTQSIRNMIKGGKLRATEVGTGTQRKVYTIKRTDLESLGVTHQEPTMKPVRRRDKPQGDNKWGL